MIPYKIPVGGLLIKATDTATPVLDLINTAIGSVQDFPRDLNYVFLHPVTQTEDILVLFDGNNPDNSTTPKTGISVFESDLTEFKGMPLDSFIIQRKGTTDCELVVQIGRVDAHGN